MFPPITDFAGDHTSSHTPVSPHAPPHGYYGVHGCAPPSPILHLAPSQQREDDRSMPRVGFEPGAFRKITSWARPELRPVNPTIPICFSVGRDLGRKRFGPMAPLELERGRLGVWFLVCSVLGCSSRFTVDARFGFFCPLEFRLL